MKITQTHERFGYLRQKRLEALEGCDRCPKCGYPNKNMPTCKTWATGLFKCRYWEVLCFRCPMCGCEWESGKFETK